MMEFVFVLAGCFLLALLFYAIQKSSRSVTGAVRGIQNLHGTSRLLVIIEILQRCARSGSQDMLLETWPSLEPALREVLLDATQGHKQQLAQALNDCHALCRNRDVARSLMVVRNEML